NAAANHGIDIDVKIGVLGEKLQLFVQHFQALLGNVIRLDVVDGNLQPFEPGAIKFLNAVGRKQIPVRDQASHHASLPDAANDLVEFGMKQWLSATNGDDRGA